MCVGVRGGGGGIFELMRFTLYYQVKISIDFWYKRDTNAILYSRTINKLYQLNKPKPTNDYLFEIEASSNTNLVHIILGKC